MAGCELWKADSPVSMPTITDQHRSASSLGAACSWESAYGTFTVQTGFEERLADNRNDPDSKVRTSWRFCRRTSICYKVYRRSCCLCRAEMTEIANSRVLSPMMTDLL